MGKYSIETYREDSIILRKGLRNKRPIYYIMKKYYPNYQGDRKKLRSEIQNCLNGNSYEKTLRLKLMPLFKKVYYVKTGKLFKK